jgi:SAM-dependent methyltransferase
MTMKTMPCPLCASQHIEIFETDLPSFTHDGFINLDRNSLIAQCRDCQILFNLIEPGAATANDRIFSSKDYSLSHQTVHKIKVNGFDHPVSRSLLQAALIHRQLKKDRPVILDVGCFNGELLKEIESHYPKAQLHGFDVSEHIKDIFVQKANFHLWLNEMEAIKGSFDLICFSHSLMYIRDIRGLMAQVKRLLNPGGLIFVQAPNIVHNPISLLLGDQYYYYTPGTLRKIFSYFAIDLNIENHEWFPREIIGFGSLKTTAHQPINQEDRSIAGCLEYLKETITSLRKIQGNGRIGVLGTTANAAFVDSILDGKNNFFIEENPDRIGKKFRHKDVCSPETLKPTDTLVIPYHQANKNISVRFREKYHGQFFCV